jgi:GNAT superfamily N-acetyltransferase
MFEKFGESARRSLFFSRNEALTLGASVITPDHIVLGILREAEPATRRTLEALGVSLPAVRAVFPRAEEPVEVPATGEIPLSMDAKTVLDHAAQVGEAERARSIGSIHLLLGVLRVTESPAAKVLGRLGLTYDKVLKAARLADQSQLPSGSSIRDAVIGDAEPIGRLITELGYSTTTAAMADRLSAILKDSGYVTFVAERDAEVVGVAGAALGRYYEKDGLYSRLVVLVVSAEARGLGVGRQLVEAVERWSADRGARDVVVNSGLQRGEAHAFYERCGYSRTGFRFVKRLDGSV